MRQNIKPLLPGKPTKRWLGALTDVAALVTVVACLGLFTTDSLAVTPQNAQGGGLQFTEVTEAAGLTYEHGLGSLPFNDAVVVSGGVAVGDYSGDGFIDLLVIRGGLGPPLLLRNNGSGGFEDVSETSGLDIDDPLATAPLFADLDGDGWLDLVLGGIADAPLRLFRNRLGVDFEEVTATSGFFSTRNNFSSTVADYDRDGDLDLFVAHWSPLGGAANHLWRNDGDTFSPVDWRVGIAPLFLTTDWTFTANFSDLDDDGWPDLLLASDFNTSRIFRNELGEDLVLDERTELTDENGMGAALGDFDNDGDFDWFVTSVWDPDGVPEGTWGVTGNRLYRNHGDGSFDEISEAAGVRQGYWGWGTCFGDFDHDGWLDIFHTNGFQAPDSTEFFEDPVRLFINRRDGTFEEQSALAGLTDTGLGRGVACFDYDRDGDLDLFIANHSGAPRLYRNEIIQDNGVRDDGREGPVSHHWLTVQLQDDRSLNRQGIGARVTLTTSNLTQVREIRCGSNYLSQNPSEAHFGLGEAQHIDSLRIRWPDGGEDLFEDFAVDQHLVIRRDDGSQAAVEIPTVSPWGLGILIISLLGATLWTLRRRSSAAT